MRPNNFTILRNSVTLGNIVQCCRILCDVVQDHAMLHSCSVQSCATLGSTMQLCATLDAMLDTKSVAVRFYGIPNRIRIDAGAVLGRPVGSKSVPKATWEHCEMSPPHPGSTQRVSKGALWRQKEHPGGSGSMPRRPKRMPSRARKRKNRVFCARLAHEASSEQFFANFRRCLVSPRSLQCL